ncbi:ABC transporter permease [Glutamicibacter protophormiae]|uniref:Spermidine/putrescine transport system permease protein n=3 Tax=Glutamicibacter protophormiae TaxID=37930 RepID=A0ABS4XKM2_GLUPR|nr:ABC transporter permease [Glutamicibacter protophormiae]MBP2397051.1 spermidine/putrescine transport system permease protein [Glutamicibacter protophormiae]QRQ77873.1 ABC transporter permease [Glutamicibacter protophormiae]WPR63893.1 ABC transporter permease [Glutamicibacter protophormiae]WPR67388.1 ABC transporter permease [Glutamicibacter protophormiae]GGL98329.1 ABC transporter permease [Glutamicibacter protophormiae]
MKLGRWFVPVVGGLAFVYLLVPIVYIFVFSFNDAGRTNLEWRGFTWDNWANPCGAPAVCESLANSLQVGIVATLIATALGTCIALGLVRYKFRFRKLTDVLIILPLATPEVVLGASLLAQFLNLGWELGYWTIVIAHTVFCMSFVIVTVRARVSSLDPRLEEAAADLYASPRLAFWKVTFPLLLPGIVAAALLSFAMSFDDFIITNFNSGNFQTFPKFIYVSATRGIPAQANVIGSAMFIIALLVVIIGQIISYRKKKQLEKI